MDLSKIWIFMAWEAADLPQSIQELTKLLIPDANDALLHHRAIRDKARRKDALGKQTSASKKNWTARKQANKKWKQAGNGRSKHGCGTSPSDASKKPVKTSVHVCQFCAARFATTATLKRRAEKSCKKGPGLTVQNVTASV
jgi:hypothetical protein